MLKYNEAINRILQILGEQTIEQDLSIEGIYEAEQADIIIEATKEELLTEGWSFNTDEGWVFTPDTDGYIAVPPTVLSVDSTSVSDKIVVKDGKLYNKTTFSYKFDKNVVCDVTWNLDFDDLPLIAQTYITLRAGRITYQNLVGDLNVVEVLSRDENSARLRLLNYEDDIHDYNIFDDSSVSRALTRGSNPTGLRG